MEETKAGIKAGRRHSDTEWTGRNELTHILHTIPNDDLMWERMDFIRVMLK